jgi:hypothetical protein
MSLLSNLTLLFRMLVTVYLRDLMGEHGTTDYGGYAVSIATIRHIPFLGIPNPGLPTI